MVNTEELKTHVSEPTKRTVQALSNRQGLTEAAWLRRLVEGALQAVNPTPTAEDAQAASRSGRPVRVTIRVRPDDHQLLEARAQARNLAPATYVAFFLRAHLRALAPLPTPELGALKRSVAELGAIGRNINQVARMAHQGGRVAGPGHHELMALLKVCEGLRDHVKALIKANLASWESGYAASTNR
jgi:hypothetical protein